MKPVMRMLCLCLTLVLLFGCAAVEPAAHRAEQEAPAAEAPDAVKTAPPAGPMPAQEPTPAPTSAPTEGPTPTPFPAPVPMTADAFSCRTAEEAQREIAVYLAAFPCPGDGTDDTYARFVTYDAAHDSVCLRIVSPAGDALLSAVLPLVEAGLITRLTLDTADGVWPGVPLPGLTELYVTDYVAETGDAFLSGCTGISKLTVGYLINDSFPDVPPAVRELTVERCEDTSLDIESVFGNAQDAPVFPTVDTLTLGIRGVDESIVLSDDADAYATYLPALTALNLWVALDADTGDLFTKLLTFPQLKTLNGRTASEYGPYAGWGFAGLKERGWIEDAEKTNGLPAAITCPVHMEVEEASNENYGEGEENVTGDTDTCQDSGFFGLAPAQLWADDGKPVSTGWYVRVYETAEAVGYYGEREWEEWAYAVTTRMMCVEIATGRVWDTAIVTRQPPRTDEENTCGAYHPLQAVQKVRALLRSSDGPYAGMDIDSAAFYSLENLRDFGTCFGKEGLPAAITGPLYVDVVELAAYQPEEQETYGTANWDEDEEYYGIPYDRIFDPKGGFEDREAAEKAAWVAVICEIDKHTKTYATEEEGFTVETHLILIEMATGLTWHKVVASSAPPAVPDEGTYGVFLPRKAVDALKSLVK